MPTPNVLIVDDDPFQRELLLTFLQNQIDAKVAEAAHGRAAIDYLATNHDSIRVVMMDMQMPVMDGIAAMKIIKEKYPHIAVVFLTATKDAEVTSTVMDLGAFDYLTKPFDRGRLVMTYRNALKYAEFSFQARQSRWSNNGTLVFSDLIGHEGGLADIVETGRKIASSNIPVLIEGETGTGKEVFARALHGESKRAREPFVAINCGAIPEHLIESILFGHEKGAFTGATEKTPGKFREAQKGTIFLDEIGDMPMSAQIRLLRVLQQHEVQPVGGSKTIPIDVRIISATNKDLLRMVQSGRFREDLFFRLNVVPLTLPPLRLRPQDVIHLAHHFIERCVEREHLRRRDLSPATEEALTSHTWPGNVRELENAIRRALALASGDILEPVDFTFDTSILPGGRRDIVRINDGNVEHSGMSVSLLDKEGCVRKFNELELEIIERVYRHIGGNILEMSKVLKVARTTLYRKLNRKTPASGFPRDS